MRYRIYAYNGNTPDRSPGRAVYDSAKPDRRRPVTEARLMEELNKAGRLSLTVLSGHRLYEELLPMKTTLEVWEDSSLLWAGRPVNITEDRARTRSYTCEGVLSWLLDVPDIFSNPASLVKDYHLGGEATGFSVNWTGLTDEKTLEHEWSSGDGFTPLATAEFGKIFHVVIDGQDYPVKLIRLHEWKGDASSRVGYLGKIGLLGNDEYEDDPNNPGANAPFYIDNARMIVQRSGDAATEQHTVKIYRRDPLTVQTMFGTLFTGNAGTGYNAYASANRKLWPGECDVIGSMIYDPEMSARCMDSLRSWQDAFGGYLSADYDAGLWKVSYTAAPGVLATDVPIKYGLNIVDITTERDCGGLTTAIYGVGVDEETGAKCNLAYSAGGSPPVTQDSGYPIASGNGYVTRTESETQFGLIRQEKEYTVTGATMAAQQEDLYRQICAELDRSAENVDAAKVTAIDPRLLGVSAGRAKVGNWYKVYAPGFSVDNKNMLLSAKTTDMIQPGRSTMTLGWSRKMMSEYVGGFEK